MKLEKICAAAVAAVIACGSAALAKDKPAAATSLRAIQIACMKQYGGYEDLQTKRIMLPSTSVTGSQSLVDAIHACVAQKTGKPATPFMRSEVTIR